MGTGLEVLATIQVKNASIMKNLTGHGLIHAIYSHSYIEKSELN